LQIEDSQPKSNVVISCQYLDCKQISKHCDIFKNLGLTFMPYIAVFKIPRIWLNVWF